MKHDLCHQNRRSKTHHGLPSAPFLHYCGKNVASKSSEFATLAEMSRSSLDLVQVALFVLEEGPQPAHGLVGLQEDQHESVLAELSVGLAPANCLSIDTGFQ